jgi:hypothetical protein
MWRSELMNVDIGRPWLRDCDCEATWTILDPGILGHDVGPWDGGESRND